VADKHKVTAAVLDKLAERHPDDATVVDYAKKVVTEATDFVKQQKLASVPNVPLDVIAMPEFKRGVAIAYCDAPGPLEKKWPHILRRRAYSERLVERAKGIVFSRVQQLHDSRFDRA
jgi:hypothetical protein